MNKLVPHYLINKKNIIKFLVFTALFSMVFINIYKPFGSEYWKQVSQTEFFLISGVMVIAGILILAFSRVIMYILAKHLHLAYWRYFTWIVVEIAIIALLYSFTAKFGYKLIKDFIELFYTAFLYTALVLFLPYAVTWLYFALQDAENMIKKITTEESFVDFGSDLLHFKDDKENLCFSVSLDNLLFIESADNYLEINYLSKGKIARFILRNSMKTIEEKFCTKPLLRCHRSYIINIEKIKVLRKDRNGVFLVFDIEGIPDIPVSKSYIEKITQIFSK
jgi:hypothetical protein